MFEPPCCLPCLLLCCPAVQQLKILQVLTRTDDPVLAAAMLAVSHPTASSVHSTLFLNLLRACKQTCSRCYHPFTTMQTLLLLCCPAGHQQEQAKLPAGQHHVCWHSAPGGGQLVQLPEGNWCSSAGVFVAAVLWGVPELLDCIDGIVMRWNPLNSHPLHAYAASAHPLNHWCGK